MRCEYAHDDGAYVLGALSPNERAGYERHMSTCPSCRDAVADLAVLPGLLARLDSTAAERIARDADAAEASRLPRLLSAAERRAAELRQKHRRRRRWQTGGSVAVAACLVAATALGVSMLIDPPANPDRPPAAMQPMVVVGHPGPVTAEVALAEVAGGTKVWMRCDYVHTAEYSKSHTFRLFAYGTNGEREQVTSWNAGPGENRSVSGVVRFRKAELDRLELLNWAGVVLLSYRID
jgi:anti-sigma factor RsiW